MKQVSTPLFFFVLLSSWLILCGNTRNPEDLKVILPGLGIDHKVNRNELLLMSKLKTNDKGAKILSFTLVTVDNNFRSRELESDSETITLEMKQAIRDAGSSERMIIKDVKVKQEREIFFLEPVTFFISE